MKTLRNSSITLALSLFLAAAAQAQGVVHTVSVGGHDQDPVGNTDANFSLVAIQFTDGTSTGQWTDQFGQGEGGFHAQINCLFVQGNQAWVSGFITSGTFGGVDLSGLPVITRVQDNGGGNTPDAISFSFIGNAAACTTAPNLVLVPMTDGQVKIR